MGMETKVGREMSTEAKVGNKEKGNVAEEEMVMGMAANDGLYR